MNRCATVQNANPFCPQHDTFLLASFLYKTQPNGENNSDSAKIGFLTSYALYPAVATFFILFSLLHYKYNIFFYYVLKVVMMRMLHFLARGKSISLQAYVRAPWNRRGTLAKQQRQVLVLQALRRPQPIGYNKEYMSGRMFFHEPSKNRKQWVLIFH